MSTEHLRTAGNRLQTIQGAHVCDLQGSTTISLPAARATENPALLVITCKVLAAEGLQE